MSYYKTLQLNLMLTYDNFSVSLLCEKKIQKLKIEAKSHPKLIGIRSIHSKAVYFQL